MAYTLQQLSDQYDALVNRIQGVPTTTQINTLGTLLGTQHQALLDLISAMTARIEVLENWRIIHMNDDTAHTGHTHDS